MTARPRLLAPLLLAVAAGAIALARVLGGVGDAGPSCADPISWRDAAAVAGGGAAVAGPVVDATYAPDVGGRPTFLNLGNSYPAPERFDVVIYAEVRERFAAPPEDLLAGETVCVVGEVRMRDGVPQVVADTHLSITVLDG